MRSPVAKFNAIINRQKIEPDRTKYSRKKKHKKGDME